MEVLGHALWGPPLPCILHRDPEQTEDRERSGCIDRCSDMATKVPEDSWFGTGRSGRPVGAATKNAAGSCDHPPAAEGQTARASCLRPRHVGNGAARSVAGVSGVCICSWPTPLSQPKRSRLKRIGAGDFKRGLTCDLSGWP